MTDNNGLYYMRARYYNVNIKRFINQDVVHGSINVSQSLNRYSYVQGNPIKLTDPFGLSPLDRLNWKNLGHAILNGLGLIPVIGEAFDIANAIWYAHDGEYGMAVLSMMSALPMIGNIASGIMTAAKITTAAKIVSTVCKVVSNAATFTQAAIGGVNNAKAIVKNMINGKLFSEDTAKNLVSFGINAFTAATSGKNLLSSSKEVKKVEGDSVGSKWGKKAKKEPLLECNLQFFADKSGGESQVFDIVEYGDKTPGLENHHGVLDIWATHNIDGYKSRASKSTTIALTPEQHAATKSVYRDWLYEKTGKKVGGKVDWTSVLPQEVQDLSERMFDAANVPLSARNDYYREFNCYIYGLERN